MKSAERIALETRVIAAALAGETYGTIGKLNGITRSAVSGIMGRYRERTGLKPMTAKEGNLRIPRVKKRAKKRVECTTETITATWKPLKSEPRPPVHVDPASPEARAAEALIQSAKRKEAANRAMREVRTL